MNLGIETETLEFKRSTGELKEAVQSICAILNKHRHGELFFGVTADGIPVGQIAISYTDKKTVLNQLELTKGEALLNAGKALFSDDIVQDIQMAIFATEERLTFNDIQRYHGPVLRLVDIAEGYIKSNIHWRVEFTGELQRKEIPEIPVDAIREALINSFCHKDYASGQSNEVTIYRDRVEIYNPGAFPEGYEPQDFIVKSERPIRRNPIIARMLYYSKDIESFGTGLKRIAEACDAAGVQYEFKKMKSGFVVCFYRSGKKADKKPIKDERKEWIVQYVNKCGSITNKDARELLGLADSTTKRLLKEMVDENVLVGDGERKSRRYLLKHQ